MTNLLLVLGIVFLGLALWKGRAQSAGEQKELNEFRQLRDELLEAKKEVGSLLGQLEQVSERVVEEITSKVREYKSLEALDNSRRNETAAILSGKTDSSKSETLLPDDDYVEYEDEDDDEDNDSQALLAEEVVRHSVERMRETIRPRSAIKGKTIIFPRAKSAAEVKYTAAANRREPVNETPPKHQMVYAMSKLGYSEEEIAKQMKIGKGEVNLMLQLKRKGEEANG